MMLAEILQIGKANTYPEQISIPEDEPLAFPGQAHVATLPPSGFLGFLKEYAFIGAQICLSCRQGGHLEATRLQMMMHSSWPQCQVHCMTLGKSHSFSASPFPFMKGDWTKYSLKLLPYPTL